MGYFAHNAKHGLKKMAMYLHRQLNGNLSIIIIILTTKMEKLKKLFRNRSHISNEG